MKNKYRVTANGFNLTVFASDEHEALLEAEYIITATPNYSGKISAFFKDASVEEIL